ncbi:MAG: hypothetical protein ACTSQS_01675 [Promethearchaeota archaeon]
MISIEQPDDLMSISLYRVLSYRQDKEFYQLVKNWNKRIVIHIKPFYPVTVIFESENIKFERGDSKKANLKVIMELDAMLDLTVLRFKKIFMTSMKLIADDPNLHYYEKKTK